MALVRYTIGAYKHSATPFKGIQESSVNPNMQQIIMAASGAVSPSFVGVGRLQPQVSFMSTAIKTILNALGPTIAFAGAAMADDKIYFQKIADDGIRGGAASHICATMANGLIVPVSINAPALPAPATISCLATPRSADGSASPLALAADASLEEGQDFDTECYVLGPATINGSELEGDESWSLNLNIGLDIVWGSGHVFPTMTGIMSITPSFTIQTFDIGKFVTWAEDGVAQTDTDSTFVLQDQLEGGVRGSSPITFTVDAGMAHFETIGGSQGSKGAGTVIMTPIGDGTADIIVVSGLT